MVKTWSKPGSHRFRYIRRSLPSLVASQLPPTCRVVIVDDCTDDARHARLLDRIAQDPRVEIWKNPRRMGPDLGQEYNVPRLLDRYPHAEYLVFCDDDIIYQPGWLQRTIQAAREGEDAGLFGVYAALNVPYRPAYKEQRLPSTEVLLKERQAALNWVMPRAVYERVGPFKDAGIAFDTEYCNRLSSLGIPVICLRPSWVQNIGYFGAYQSGTHFVARDFVGRIGPSLWLNREYHTRKAQLRELGSQVKQRIRRLAATRS